MTTDHLPKQRPCYLVIESPTVLESRPTIVGVKTSDTSSVKFHEYDIEYDETPIDTTKVQQLWKIASQINWDNPEKPAPDQKVYTLIKRIGNEEVHVQATRYDKSSDCKARSEFIKFFFGEESVHEKHYQKKGGQQTSNCIIL